MGVRARLGCCEGTLVGLVPMFLRQSPVAGRPGRQARAAGARHDRAPDRRDGQKEGRPPATCNHGSAALLHTRAAGGRGDKGKTAGHLSDRRRLIVRSRLPAWDWKTRRCTEGKARLSGLRRQKGERGVLSTQVSVYAR